MPTPTKAKSSSKEDGRHAAEAAAERLDQSLDAAQKALKAIGGDVSRGTRDMAKNVERMLSATRKDARKLARAVRADVTKFQKEIGIPKRAAGTRATGTRTTSRSSTTRSSTTRSRARTTGGKSA